MNKPLILVVEDDPSIRNLITTTLKTNDYRYVVAPNGSAAIMEATSHNPEIILLDLGLPDMDGVQVIQTVRSWSNTPSPKSAPHQMRWRCRGYCRAVLGSRKAMLFH